MEPLGVVVGEVVTVRPHPNGERIWLADVNVGREFKPQIVWGGKKLVKEGSFVPVALPGARLPMGKIRRRRYRGQISEGMLCSLAELGWDASVHDRVALLKRSAGLKPGDPLDDIGSDWRKYVEPRQID
jgi:tRNA-binding EMAP/Myf-like protein